MSGEREKWEKGSKRGGWWGMKCNQRREGCRQILDLCKDIRYIHASLSVSLSHIHMCDIRWRVAYKLRGQADSRRGETGEKDVGRRGVCLWPDFPTKPLRSGAARRATECSISTERCKHPAVLLVCTQSASVETLRCTQTAPHSLFNLLTYMHLMRILVLLSHKPHIPLSVCICLSTSPCFFILPPFRVGGGCVGSWRHTTVAVWCLPVWQNCSNSEARRRVLAV